MTRQNHKRGFNLTRSHSEAIAHKTRKGFNLIEAAIVLAVVGGVIGGIWTAAAHFYEEYKVNKTVSDLALIVKNIQGLISIRDAEAIGNAVNIRSELKDAGSFPEDWIDGNIIRSPVGVVDFWNYLGGGGLSAGATVRVEFKGINRINCINLTVKLSSIGKMANTMLDCNSPANTSLTRIIVYTPSVSTLNTCTFPIIPQQAEDACTNPNNNIINFYYGYTRINN